MNSARDTTDRPFIVLVVDDNDDLLYAVRMALELLGNFRVLTAKDGIEGLECATNEHPNCAVIDVKMPGLDGYQLVRALRGDPQTAEIPLIILSALAQETDQLIGVLSGADQYLLKPLNAMQLVSAIQLTQQLTAADRAEHMRQLDAAARQEPSTAFSDKEDGRT